MFRIAQVNSCSRNAQVTLVGNPQWKIKRFKNYKHWYLIHLDLIKILRVPTLIGKCTIFVWRVTWNHANTTVPIKYLYNVFLLFVQCTVPLKYLYNVFLLLVQCAVPLKYLYNVFLLCVQCAVPLSIYIMYSYYLYRVQRLKKIHDFF